MTVAQDIVDAKNLDRILDQAWELASYCQHVVVVPKDPSLAFELNNLVPEQFLLGYSVPTRHGSTHDEALRLRPDYPDAQFNKSWALIRLERYSEAIEWLCRAWHSRARFPDRGQLVALTLREMGFDPADCE